MADDNSKTGDVWGFLTLVDGKGDPALTGKVPLKACKISIGRAKDCDISFVDNKLLSGHHCTLTSSKEEGQSAVLQDSSTNGTLLDGKKIKNGQVAELSDGSEIYLVRNKRNPEMNLAYRFQYAVSSDVQDTSELENTQEYDADTENDDDDTENYEYKDEEEPITSGKGKRSADFEKSDSEPQPKHIKKDDSVNEKCRPKPESSTHSSVNASESKDGKHKEEMQENLTCGICQDVFHDCVSAQPCMHSFCAACYSEWMVKSSKCPSCRRRVKQVSKNHIINNLVESFLNLHPDRRRSEEEIKDMDQKNKIKSELVKVKDRADPFFFDTEPSDGSEDGRSDDSDESSPDGDTESESNDDDNVWILGANATQAFNFGIGRHASAFLRPAGARCRQCPDYIPQSLSLPVVNEDRQPPPYTCSPNQVHVVCNCCWQMMPDRSNQQINVSEQTANDIPPVKCNFCGNFFCHLYWGCQKQGCSGCLNKFQDMDFGDKCLSKLILENDYESNILKDYLQSNNINVKDLLDRCVEKLRNGDYTIPLRPDLDPEEITCYTCGLKFFRELAYQYRSDIPPNDLPADVNNRPICYWGRNCRTQRHTPHHAITSNSSVTIHMSSTPEWSILSFTKIATPPEASLDG